MMRLNIDLPLSVFDLTAFNDIPTGYTPTTPKDGSFRDCSKLENLDTPTPLGNPDTEGYFVYPPDRRRPEDGAHDEEYGYPMTNRNQSYDGVFTSTTSSAGYPYSYSAEAMKSSFLERINCDTDRIATTVPSYLYFSDSSTCSPQSNVPSSLDGTPLQGSSDLIFANENCVNLTERNRTNLTLSIMEHVNDPPVRFPSCVAQQQQQFQEIYPPRIVDPTRAMHYAKPEANSDLSENVCLPCGISTQASIKFNFEYSNGLQPEVSPVKSKMIKKTIQKAFQCQHPGCVKQFARIDELRRHQRTHSDVRQFVCETCFKGFTRSDHLMTHRRTHTGERPYPCNFCDRRFARSDERNRHIKVHSRNKVRHEKKTQCHSGKLTIPVTGTLQLQPTGHIFL